MTDIIMNSQILFSILGAIGGLSIICFFFKNIYLYFKPIKIIWKNKTEVSSFAFPSEKQDIILEFLIINKSNKNIQLKISLLTKLKTTFPKFNFPPNISLSPEQSQDFDITLKYNQINKTILKFHLFDKKRPILYKPKIVQRLKNKNEIKQAKFELQNKQAEDLGFTSGDFWLYGKQVRKRKE